MALLTLLLALATKLTTWQFAMEQHDHVMPADTSAAWQTVTIPHDWAITTPFDRANDLQTIAVVQNGETLATTKTGRSGGLNWMGAAWYRCPLALSPSSHLAYLLMDGAMSRAEIYLDGEKIGEWPYGYNSFVVPLPSGHLAASPSRPIQLSIRLENMPESSRWYPGAGLYRNVYLIEKNEVHIPLWGIKTTIPIVTDSVATLSVEVELKGDRLQVKGDRLQVVTELRDAENQVVATIEGEKGETRIEHPHMWSPESPYLYKLYTSVYEKKKRVDIDSVVIGFRSIDYSLEKGFLLNGQPRKFQGVCLHHDLGPLGAAVDHDAILHQLTLLKDMGCDAVRTSHNMPAPELVSLCEQMGFMLMIEPFDVWNWAKCRNDYSNFFNDWAERDMTNMILHYRNSPAVVMWSIGNEVPNQRTEDGPQIAQWLQDICHRLDPTRPVTCGMDKVKEVIYNGFAAVMDIPGFNYRTGRYEEAHRQLPNRLILGSETSSTVSSRGAYHFPTVIAPNRLHEDGQCSSYDLEYCAWSGLPDQDFQLQDDYPWTIGQFVWTGQDYLGEPTPYDTDAWPSHSSYFGIIDLAMLPKDRYYLYRSQWNKQSPTLHVLPHWNWPGREGQVTPVYVYTSYPEAELFVNGVSQGRLRFATADEAERLRQGEIIEGVSRMPQVGEFTIPDWGTAPRPDLLPRYRLMWQDVRYEPGEIKVVAYDKNGSVADERIVRTAGEAVALKATLANAGEPTKNGLRYITIQAVDANGNLCSQANDTIVVSCEKSVLVGAANGDPTCLLPLAISPSRPLASISMPLFHGQATFLIRVNEADCLNYRIKGGGPCGILPLDGSAPDSIISCM